MYLKMQLKIQTFLFIFQNHAILFGSRYAVEMTLLFIVDMRCYTNSYCKAILCEIGCKQQKWASDVMR